MTTNFTLRDFFAYVLTGCTFLIAMVIPFRAELLQFTKANSYLNDYSWGWLLLLIPGIYLIGHLFGIFSYMLLRIYCWIESKINNKKSYFLKVVRCLLLYKSKVAYAKSNYNKKNKHGFWTNCAILQIEKNYAPAGYWYYLNEFFQSLILIFALSSIISFWFCHFCIGAVYLFLAFLSFWRAKQYANLFVKTVCRTMQARKIIR